MNNETIRTGIEAVVATEALIGLAAGYAIGQFAERDVLKNRESSRSLLQVHENVEASDVHKRSVLTRAVTGLAIMGAMTGYAIGQAVDSHETVTKSKPVVELVVDHSREVQEGRLGDGSVKKIDAIATEIMKNKDVSAKAVISHGDLNQYEVKTTKEVIEDGKGRSPTGSASVAEATDAAIDKAFSSSETVETNSLNASRDRNAAVLVVTNGNTLGIPAAVITKAKENGNIPIFIADTGSTGNTSDVVNSKNFKQITSATNGKYWHVPKDATDIEKTIKQELSPQTKKSTNSALRFVAALLAAGLLTETFRKWRNRRLTLDDQEAINS